MPDTSATDRDAPASPMPPVTDLDMTAAGEQLAKAMAFDVPALSRMGLSVRVPWWRRRIQARWWKRRFQRWLLQETLREFEVDR